MKHKKWGIWIVFSTLKNSLGGYFSNIKRLKFFIKHKLNHDLKHKLKEEERRYNNFYTSLLPKWSASPVRPLHNDFFYFKL
jgi:hypothetical protein